MLIIMRFSHDKGHADHADKDYNEHRNTSDIAGKTGH